MKAIFLSIAILFLLAFPSCKKDQTTDCLRDNPEILTDQTYLQKLNFENRIWQFKTDKTLTVHPDLPDLTEVFITVYEYEFITCDVIRLKLIGHMLNDVLVSSNSFSFYDLIILSTGPQIRMIFDPINDLASNTPITLILKN